MKRKTELISINNSLNQSFNDFYTKNTNWMDDPAFSVLDTLRSFYGEFFKGQLPDYNNIREILVSAKGLKDQKPSKAKELFKSLFKMPYKNTRTIDTDELSLIESQFGARIIAHGVEEAKGGMYNLLLMCVADKVWAPSAYWGPFVSGLPNVSPLSHGPYYLIYKMPTINETAPIPNNPKLSNIARILLPFGENRSILIEKLDEMVQKELITESAKDNFVSKLITYAEFLEQLKIVSSADAQKENRPIRPKFFSKKNASDDKIASESSISSTSPAICVSPLGNRKNAI